MNLVRSLIILVPLGILTFFAVVIAMLQGDFHYIPLIIVIPTILFLLATLLIYNFFKTKLRIVLFSILTGASLIVSAIFPIFKAYN